MRIVINAISLKLGGGARYITEVLRELASRSSTHEIVALLPPELSDLTAIIDGNIHIHIVPHMSLWKRLWWDHVKLRRFLRQQRADVLFSSANFGMVCCPVSQVLLVQTVIYISRPYRVFLKVQPIHDRLKFYLRRYGFLLSVHSAHSVMLPTESALRELLDTTSFGANKIVNPYGVRKPHTIQTDSASADDASRALITGNVKLLFVSIYYEHKNLKTLLRCLPILNHADNGGSKQQFILWTTAHPDSAPHRSVNSRDDWILARADNVRPFVKFIDRLNHSEIEELYRAADICVFPSVVESFGLPMVEAMAFGLPVVAADTPVNREICRGAARYFSPFDPSALAREIQLVAGDAMLQSELRTKGLERAQAFEWGEHVDRIIDTARDLYEGRRHQPVRGVEQRQC